MPPETISLAIVDDHAVFVEALSIVLQREQRIDISGTAASCAGCRELVRRGCPDVLLLDVNLPDGDGIDLIPQLKAVCPNTHVLVLTSMSDDKTLLRAIEAGVSGFVAKSRSLTEVLAAIQQAADGEIVIPASLLRGLLARMPHAQSNADPALEPLTPRETEVLSYLARGQNTASVAAALSISPLTVRTHIRNLISKLRVHSRLEAVAYALRHGLINLPD